MITFKQFLNEVFDKPLPYKIDPEGSGLNAAFKTSDGKVMYIVSVSKHDDGKGLQYEILFSHEIANSYNLNVGMRNDNKYQVEVISTVVKIVKDYFSKTPLRKGDIITFSASNKETGKIKLYRRFMKQIANEINGTYEEDNLGFATSFLIFKR